MTELVALVGIVALVAIVALVMGRPFRGRVEKGGVELEAGTPKTAGKRTRKKD